MNGRIKKKNAGEISITILFDSKTPVPVSYKSNDCILCQLYRCNEIDEGDISVCRMDERKITYSKEQPDHSVVLVTEVLVEHKLSC